MVEIKLKITEYMEGNREESYYVNTKCLASEGFTNAMKRVMNEYVPKNKHTTKIMIIEPKTRSFLRKKYDI